MAYVIEYEEDSKFPQRWWNVHWGWSASKKWASRFDTIDGAKDWRKRAQLSAVKTRIVPDFQKSQT